MDRIDIKILNILQRDASLPLATIAKKVDLSTTPCFNRIKKLEEMGVIKKRIAILDNKKINLPIVVFLSITVAQHSKEWLVIFIDKLSSFDEVVEIYRLTGNSDYLIKKDYPYPHLSHYKNLCIKNHYPILIHSSI